MAVRMSVLWAKLHREEAESESKIVEFDVLSMSYGCRCETLASWVSISSEHENTFPSDRLFGYVDKTQNRLFYCTLDTLKVIFTDFFESQEDYFN